MKYMDFPPPLRDGKITYFIPRNNEALSLLIKDVELYVLNIYNETVSSLFNVIDGLKRLGNIGLC